MTKRVVTFGEIMLRLSPPGYERLFQTPRLDVFFGGGEANVAASLAQFGFASRFLTRLPNNPVGESALKSLRAEGVDTSFIVRGGSRLGIYFAEKGASQRASTVVYDRAHSAVSELKPEDIDWKAALDGADWFHVTGITPALGESARRCTEVALEAARSAGAKISIDLNYRAKLWSREQAQRAMKGLSEGVDLIIANEEDLQSCLGVDVGVDVASAKLDVVKYEDAAKQVVDQFRVGRVAITLRESFSASRNGWSALLFDAKTSAVVPAPHYDVALVDRIGGGDSFSAGLIHGLLSGRSNESALAFAVAASALKQTIAGDFNHVSVAEVERLAGGDQSGRVQR